ncbi:MAG: gfo/Idh/MocA family oxidoreductase, partial [Paracoccaceae bacterium]
AIANNNLIFDLAIPPSAHQKILELIPKNSAVILQKPMGSNLKEASEILTLCHQKSLNACVNFQLRFAPMMIALKDIINKGLLGEIVDIDMWAALDTPWSLWKFLENLPRVEILLHSIHYFDAIRFLVGNTLGIHAKTIGHPA